MDKIIRSGDKAVQDIVNKAKQEQARKTELDALIAQNWLDLKEMKTAYLSKTEAMPVYLAENNLFYEVLPDKSWKGQRCFIIGGGESLKDFDFSKLKGELTIGINRAFEKHYCTINFSMDRQFYEWLINGKLGKEALRKWNAYKGYKVFCRMTNYKYKNVIKIEKNELVCLQYK